MYKAVIFTDATDNIAVSIPIGAYKIAHSLRKNGYPCLVVNHLSNWTEEELKELIDQSVDENTILFGISTTFLRSVEFERDPSKPTPPFKDLSSNTMFPQGKEFEDKIIAYLKSRSPNIKVMLGGAKAAPECANKNIDYVFLGFSEGSVANLANHLAKGEELLNSHKNIWGRIIVDDRLGKTYDFQHDSMAWEDTDVVNHKVLTIEVGRGCIFKCTFCAYPLNGKKKLDFVKTSDLVRDELDRNYKQFGVRHYMIVDDTFNDHVEKLIDIRDAVRQLDFQPIFWAYHRLDLLCARPETVQILYDIGIRAMYFGIETLYETTGKLIGKRHDRKKQLDMVRHIKSTYPDVTLHGSFIVGLPTEPVESFYKTFNSLMNNELLLDSWKFHGFVLNKLDRSAFKSEFDLHPEKYGLVDQGTDPHARFINWKSEHTDAVEAKRIADEFMDLSGQSGKLKIPGEMALYLADSGYKDFDTLIKTPFSDIEWNYLEYTVRPKFISEYKSKLLTLVKNKH